MAKAKTNSIVWHVDKSEHLSGISRLIVHSTKLLDLIPNCTLQTQRHEVFRNKCEVFKRHPKLITRHDSQDIDHMRHDHRFPKLIQTLPTIYEVDPKTAKDFQRWSKVLRRFPKSTRRIKRLSEVQPKCFEDFRRWTEEFQRFLKTTRTEEI